MKVLHIITGLGNGGAEGVLCRLIAHTQKWGIEHHVVSLMGRGVYAKELEEIGVFVYAANFPKGGVSLKGLVEIFRLIRVLRPDVIQTWMYHADLIGGVLGRLAGVRAVAWGIRHANLDPLHNSRSTLYVVRLCAFLSRWVPRKIVSCSAESTRLHHSIGYASKKFLDIPNGYSMTRFKPDASGRDAVRIEQGIVEDEFVLGMVGRFNIQKNHQNLVDALGQLQRRGVPFICLLVGVGMDESNVVLRGWLEEAGIVANVRLLGPRSDIPEIMNALDIHVLSSLGEAFPNVLAEAMACGTPCVTTDVGDASVIVANQGWIVAPQDAGALVDGLVCAYDSFAKKDTAWQQLRIACRAHIMANFELEQMCERYRQAWSACMLA